MSDRPSHNLGNLNIDMARRIDEVCRRFESDWREGRQFQIEDYLGAVPDEVRPALRAELIALERELCPSAETVARPEIGPVQAAGPQRTPSPSMDANAPRTSRTILRSGNASSSVHEEATIPPSDSSAGQAQSPHDLPTATGLDRGVSAGPDVTEPFRIRYFGDYEITREIARGGMGVVFEARQMSLNRDVALKMILAGQLANEADVKRFHAEAEAAANLDHPGIVPIYEVGQHEGQHFFSMGLVNGQSLAKRLATGPLGSRAAAELFLKVAEAVDYAHRRGVIHRDIKPANILLDRRGRPRITDFGLAKRVEGDSSLTASGQIMGTPSYMAPEQAAASKDITTSVDVYSVGATLYEALAGRPPFRGASPLETLIEVLERQPPAPRSLIPEVDRGLELICLKCLEKDPTRRYAAASDLADDLRRWLDDEPLSVRPPGLREQAGRWLRRNARVALLVVLIGMIWGLSTSIPLATWLGNPAIDSRALVDIHQLWPDSLSTPLGWIKLVVGHPWLNRLALSVAALMTLSIGWLVAGPLSPRTRLTAFGLAAACGLIASVTSFLFVGPFEAVRARRAMLHPVYDEYNELYNLRTTVRLLSSRSGGRATERFEYVGDTAYLSRFLPARSPGQTNDERDFHLGFLRSQARHVNRLQNVFTASWTTMLSALMFYLLLSLTGTAAATDPLASGRSLFARLGRYLEFYLPASLAVLCGVALFFLQSNQHITEARKLTNTVRRPPIDDWSYRWIPPVSQARGTADVVSGWTFQMIPLVGWLGMCAALARLGQWRGWSVGVRVAVGLGWIITATIVSIWLFGEWARTGIGWFPLDP